LHVAPFG
jgi:hypothetical protein